MLTFGDWLLGLPKSERPKTAAYATEDDPFLGPEVAAVQAQLQKAGIKTVYQDTYPIEIPSYSPIALAISKSKAQVVILGSNLPDSTAFTETFVQQHYNPLAIDYASGPDQGSQWIKAVGANNTAGTTVPLGWLPTYNTTGNKAFVQAYTKKYGGTEASMSTDAGEAYSVGQVMAQAIEAAGTLSNSAVIAELHKMTFKTVQGDFGFNKNGLPCNSANGYTIRYKSSTQRRRPRLRVCSRSPSGARRHNEFWVDLWSSRIGITPWRDLRLNGVGTRIDVWGHAGHQRWPQCLRNWRCVFELCVLYAPAR